MDGRAFVFLNGYYPRGDDRLVRGLVRRTRPRPLLVAVDGGIAFLQRIKIKPDVWISDLDSAPRIKKGFLGDVEVLLFPADKEKTDAELAIDLCTREAARDITVFGWDVRNSETDHVLGTLLLCRNLKGRKRHLSLRFLDSRQEIIAIADGRRTLRGYKGRRLSVIPMSSSIRLTLTGTAYPARELKIREGETIALRNRITAERMTVSVTGVGLAIIA